MSEVFETSDICTSKFPRLFISLLPMNKLVKDAKEGIAGVKDGMTLMLGGFGLCGIPENCISALVDTGVKDLTCISETSIQLWLWQVRSPWWK